MVVRTAPLAHQIHLVQCWTSVIPEKNHCKGGRVPSGAAVWACSSQTGTGKRDSGQPPASHHSTKGAVSYGAEDTGQSFNNKAVQEACELLCVLVRMGLVKWLLPWETSCFRKREAFACGYCFGFVVLGFFLTTRLEIEVSVYSRCSCTDTGGAMTEVCSAAPCSESPVAAWTCLRLALPRLNWLGVLSKRVFHQGCNPIYFYR